MLTLATDSPPPRARGRTGGRRPKLNAEQIALPQQLYDAGERTVQQIADVFNVPRTTVYGHLDPASTGKRPAPQRRDHGRRQRDITMMHP